MPFSTSCGDMTLTGSGANKGNDAGRASTARQHEQRVADNEKVALGDYMVCVTGNKSEAGRVEAFVQFQERAAADGRLGRYVVELGIDEFDSAAGEHVARAPQHRDFEAFGVDLQDINPIYRMVQTKSVQRRDGDIQGCCRRFK